LVLVLGVRCTHPAAAAPSTQHSGSDEYLFTKTDSRATIGPPSRGDVPLHTEAAGTAPPDAFGPFRVLHQVGAGTLGPVFRAYDADRARLVAVKVLRLDLPPERLHQLVAELERLIAAELAHPVVAAPIATGTDGLVIYLAQEYVPADSLDVVLRDEGPPAPADALRVAAQLAGALDFAAAAKVYHGVLHPRDVLIAQDDTRLTGLGVAAAIEKIGVAAPRRRPYTAPERMAGAAWDRRADIFSLAALIHEMLWGRRLTAIGAEAAAALTDLPGAHLARLKAAFARALAPDPDDRFDSAMDFATALGEAFPLSARPSASAGPAIEGPDTTDEDATIELRPDTTDEDATIQLRPDPTDEDATIRLRPDPTDEDATIRLRPDTTDAYGAQPPVEARLPFEPDLRNGLDDGAGSEEEDAGRAGRKSSVVPESDDLELRPTGNASYDELEIAPVSGREPAADSAAPAAVPIAPLEEMSPLRNGAAGRFERQSRWNNVEDDAGRTEPRSEVTADGFRAGADDGLTGSAPRSRLFQPYQVDPPERVDQRDEPDHPARSLIAPLAAALIVGLALGFAGGYALGGRRGAPAVASVPPATAPSMSSTAPPGREFTEAAVSGDTVQPKPPASARPTPIRPAVERPNATNEKGTTKAAAPSATAPGRLLVRSTPAGARVFVDGREQGQTPATIRDLTRGTHRIRIVRDGYVAEERRIAITVAQPSQTMTVDLKRTGAPAGGRSTGPPAAAPATVGASVGALTVISRPDGARVFLDGRLVGTTPLSLPQVAAGEHAVRLEREGYRRWSSSVRVAGGQGQRVTASLER
jgi:serine/threonine protein kinase